MVKKDSSIQYVGLKKLSHKYIHIGIFHMKVNLIHTKSIFEIIFKNVLEQGNKKMDGSAHCLLPAFVQEEIHGSGGKQANHLYVLGQSGIGLLHFWQTRVHHFDKDGPAHFISHPSPQTNQPLPVRKSLAVGGWVGEGWVWRAV